MSHLNDLKNQLLGQFPDGCAEELEAIEETLKFEAFNQDVVLALGNEMVRLLNECGKEAAIRITREKDQLPVFQYVMDSKSQRNIDFGLAKRATVLKTGHCSLWAMAKEMTDGGLEEIFKEDSGCLPVGGAFPIYIGDEMVATIFISGLHEGLDHILIVQTLSNLLGREVPVYHGAII